MEVVEFAVGLIGDGDGVHVRVEIPRVYEVTRTISSLYQSTRVVFLQPLDDLAVDWPGDIEDLRLQCRHPL